MSRALALCAAGAVALAIAIALLSGCGVKFQLPTESNAGLSHRSDGSYAVIATWPGMDGVADLLLTQGRGSQLFVVFRGAGGAPGRVLEYALNSQAVIERHPFPGVLNPAAICAGGGHVYVLDQGDTLHARTDQLCRYETPCDSNLAGFTRPIVDLTKYWRVREYQLYGGDSLSTFTDTTFAWVSGVAADAEGRVYVGGVAIICSIDRFDSRIKTIATEYRIRRYVKGGSHPDMPGAAWHRDDTYELVEGTGIGSTRDPRGMQWVPAGQGGPSLFFADLGNDEVQKFADPGSSAFSFKLESGGSGRDSIPLARPEDVAVDGAGFVYVADTQNRRVLRYDPDRAFIQRVDVPTAPGARALVDPAAVAADDSLVYVADPVLGVVVRYKRTVTPP
jgi:DNA-binding beta-propeller fold protein YncE